MNDDFEEVLGPLAKLRRRVEGVLADQGLAAVEVSIVPGRAADGPHVVHILAMLADADPQPERRSDDGFDEVLRGARDAELERRSQDAIEQLKRQLRDDGGFL